MPHRRFEEVVVPHLDAAFNHARWKAIRTWNIRRYLPVDGGVRERDLETHVVLPSGRLLRIRSLQQGDEEPVRAFCDGLTPRTRYLRFLSHVPRTPDSVVRMLTSVDGRRALALVATADTEDAEEIVGLANLIAVDDCRMEVGLVVRDDWHRQRVGTALAHRMLQAAHARGFDQLVAHVAWDNVAIRGLLHRHGRIVSATRHGSVTEITFVGRT